MASATSNRFDVRPASSSGQHDLLLSHTPTLSVLMSVSGDENEETTGSFTHRNNAGSPAVISIIPDWNDSSFSEDTLETMPRSSHYAMPNVLSSLSSKTGKRQTLEALQEGMEESSADELFHQSAASSNLYFSTYPTETELESALDEKVSSSNVNTGRFGWFSGVFVRSVFSFCGIVLFWRLSWVIGTAGVVYTSGLLIFILLLCTLTALSVAAIYSNVIVRTGDAYFVISRSLGPEFGTCVGFLLTITNILFTAFNIVGLAEFVEAVLVVDPIRYSLLADGNPVNDVRIIGFFLLTILVVVVIVLKRQWEARIQPILFGFIALAFFTFLVGAFRPAHGSVVSDNLLDVASISNSNRHVGFTGLSLQTLQMNLWPAPSVAVQPISSFSTEFSLLFPLAAGVIAGVDIAGDLLRDAPNAVPRGSLLSLGAAGLLYIVFSWLLAASVTRNALDGSLDELNWQGNCSAIACSYAVFSKYRSMMDHASVAGPLLIPGFIVAAFASARTAFVCGARVFYAVCGDRLFPHISYFGGLTSGSALFFPKCGAPVRAYVAAFMGVAVAVFVVADVNAIARALSIIMLMLFSLINYACFDASLAESPGFRPRFLPYYSKWTALAGALLAVIAAFAVSWQTSLAIVMVIAALSVYVYRVAKPAAAGAVTAEFGTTGMQQQHDWGTSWDANMYRRALAASLRLIRTVDHVKTYRPQALVLTGFPASRPALVDLVAAFTNNEQALMMCANVIVLEKSSDDATGAARLFKSHCHTRRQVYDWLERRRVNAFYTQIIQSCPSPSAGKQYCSSSSLRQGARALMEGVGLGKLRPNVVFMGYLTDFSSRKFADISNYVGTISDAFDCNMGVGLLKMSHIGMDLRDVYAHQQQQRTMRAVQQQSTNEHDDSAADISPSLNIAYGNDTDRLRTSAHGKGRQHRRPSVPANASHFNPPVLPFSAAPSVRGSRVRRSSEQYESTAAAAIAHAAGSDDDSKWPSSSEQIMQSLSAQQEVLLRKVKQANYFTRQVQQQQQPALPRIILSPTIVKNAGVLTNNPDNSGTLTAATPCIHVWWLYDDGGLTVLIPYLLARKWKLPLHLFYLNPTSSANDAELKDIKSDDDGTAPTKNELALEKRRKASRVDNSQRKMLRLLHKFRISVENVTPITIDKWPTQEAELLLEKVKLRMGRYYSNAIEKLNFPTPPVPTTGVTGNVAVADAGVVNDAEFECNRDKTLRQLKLCQLMQQHSSSAALIVLSLPMYRQSVSPAMYAMWLECLTGGMTNKSSNVGSNSIPPVLLLRGNQQSVLTFDL